MISIPCSCKDRDNRNSSSVLPVSNWLTNDIRPNIEISFASCSGLFRILELKGLHLHNAIFNEI